MFFDRISRSFELAKSAWRVLIADKKLVLFPIISGIVSVIVILSFTVPIGVLAANGMDITPQVNEYGEVTEIPVWYYPVLFGFYFVSYFVIIFFNSALVSCALMKFNGQEASLGDGFKAAGSRLPQILMWALVSATVGILLKAIENSNRRVGYFISAILGTAWTVMTFFVVPILVVEKTDPIKAVSRSIELLKKSWGEALVGNFGLGFFKFLLMLPGIVLMVIGVFIAITTLGVGLVVIIAGVMALLLAIAVGATLQTIFVAALYQYAAFGRCPDAFDRDTLSNAFTTRSDT
jgi:hypothetical protein